MERTKQPISRQQEEINYWNNYQSTIDLFSSTAFLVINKQLLRFYGPDRAVFISNLIDKLRYFRPDDGWFFHTHLQQVEETGFAEYTIKGMKKELIANGILQTRKRGLPAKEYYKINFNILLETLDPHITKAPHH
jgi:hypothetical protein